MPVPVLFCADPLNPRRVDDHFAAQADAVRAAGGTVGLIDHDALTRGDADAAVRRLPRGLGPAWYRGWMIGADHYGDLASALADKGGELVVPPDNYRRAHELPGWPDLPREPDLSGVAAPVRVLGCRFVTTDLARRTDGTWRVVEVGDGQVSDLPGTVDPYPLMDRLSSCAAR